MLNGDVLQPSTLQGEDARVEIVQAVYFTAQMLVQELPALVGDAVACVLLFAVLVHVEPLRLIVVALVVMLIAACALAMSRARVEKSIDRAWALKERVFDTLLNALDGRLKNRRRRQTRGGPG